MLPTICRTFIFEDSYFDMEAIRSILAKIQEIQVIGEAATIGEALEICRSKQPNLIIADGSIHDDKTIGPNFVKSVRKELPDVRILGLTRYPELVESLKRAGCDFVVNKTVIDNHNAAVKYIKETLLPRPQYAVMLELPKLTTEEGEILRLICEGMTEEQIASQYGHTTRKPIRRIKNNLFKKFGAASVAQLVHLAYKTGYLRADED
jgi:two-component system response regulator DevR